MAKILYVGRFELPDKEATANRVVGNAKLLRELGHEVILAGWSDDVPAGASWQTVECYGFESYEKHKAKTSYEKYKMFSDASPELEMLRRVAPDVLIAYDFPAVALSKLMKYCKKQGIKCICDVSEWYTNKNKNPLFRVVRAYDSHKRMRVLHKKADGLIVISKYLQNYYSEQKTVLIPPLADVLDSKWGCEVTKADDGICRLAYVGWPSRSKERLDLVVRAVKSLSEKSAVRLDVFGINEKQFCEMYGTDPSDIGESVAFHGRVSHHEALRAVKNADYSLIIRESSRKNNAGFPSKLVECITCGTAVLTTDISNVKDYVGEGRNGYIISIDDLEVEFEKAIAKHKEVTVEKNIFDYRNFKEAMADFLKGQQIN